MQTRDTKHTRAEEANELRQTTAKCGGAGSQVSILIVQPNISVTVPSAAVQQCLIVIAQSWQSYTSAGQRINATLCSKLLSEAKRTARGVSVTSPKFEFWQRVVPAAGGRRSLSQGAAGNFGQELSVLYVCLYV